MGSAEALPRGLQCSRAPSHAHHRMRSAEATSFLRKVGRQWCPVSRLLPSGWRDNRCQETQTHCALRRLHYSTHPKTYHPHAARAPQRVPCVCA